METSRNPLNLLACKCPRCREGNMFENKNPYVLKDTMKMNTACPVCGQALNIEVGFYYGSSYISYAVSLLISAVSFAAWYFTIGFSLNDNRLYYWLAANAVLLVVLQPYLMRFARTGWLAFFVGYKKDWKNMSPVHYERVNRQQENNW